MGAQCRCYVLVARSLPLIVTCLRMKSGERKGPQGDPPRVLMAIHSQDLKAKEPLPASVSCCMHASSRHYPEGCRSRMAEQPHTCTPKESPMCITCACRCHHMRTRSQNCGKWISGGRIGPCISSLCAAFPAAWAALNREYTSVRDKRLHTGASIKREHSR